MKKNLYDIAVQKGSMMIEALAMLGLITMVTPVLYKKAAERTTELQDINTAGQMRTLSKALDDYIKDNYSIYDHQVAEGTITEAGIVEEVKPDELVDYLPRGFNLERSRNFDEYQFSIRVVPIEPPSGSGGERRAAITGMVLAPVITEARMGHEEAIISSIRSSKIASMIGSNGGVYRKCKGSKDEDEAMRLCGVQGGWAVKPEDYDFTGEIPEGSIAVSSVHAVTASSGGADKHALYRDGYDGRNVMQVELDMDGNQIINVGDLIAQSEKGFVNIMKDDGDSDYTPTITDPTLVVQGSAEITDLLKAGSANISDAFTVGDPNNPLFKVDPNDTDSKIVADDKVTINKGGLDIKDGGSDIAGTVNIKGDGDGKGGSIMSGVADSRPADPDSGSPADDYTLVVKKDDSGKGGSVLIENNLKVEGDFFMQGDLEADRIHARVELGGGKRDDGTYNFVATKDKVEIQSDTDIGGNVNIAGDTVIESGNLDVHNRILADASGVLLTGGTNGKNSGYLLDLQDSGADLRAANHNEEILLRPGSIEMNVVGGSISANSANGSYTLDSDGAIISGHDKSLELTRDGAILRVEDGAGTTTSYIKLENNQMGVDSENIIIDNDKIIFGEHAKTQAGEFDASGNYNNGVITDGVIIRRDGMINLPAASSDKREALPAGQGQQDVPGYIKLDRVLANQNYKDPWKEGDYPNSGVVKYDAYMLNPAYTSVMHDIKLTTRGGARLSDILPDFINKGIYVIDNTYKEIESKRKWEDYVVTTGGGKITISGAPTGTNEECTHNDGNCITTPWLGFVPTPQCPPGYSKVITISPIRWKMSEAYYVADDPKDSLGEVERFKHFFISPRDPSRARFEISSVATPKDGSSHTHTLVGRDGTASTGAMPLTFQTNTWLNTTIGAVREGQKMSAGPEAVRGDFVGWHAIMGFLYNGGDYKEYLAQVAPGHNYDNEIMWNLFPVYNEEQTAIANVYCYFERRDYTGKEAPHWKWERDLVDTGYNQMGGNFRSGYSKDGAYGSKGSDGRDSYVGSTAYKDRLNDPALKYNDPW